MGVSLIVAVSSGIEHYCHVMTSVKTPLAQTPTFPKQPSGPISHHRVFIGTDRHKNGSCQAQGIRKHMQPHPLAGIPNPLGKNPLYFDAFPNPFAFAEAFVGDKFASPAWMDQ